MPQTSHGSAIGIPTMDPFCCPLGHGQWEITHLDVPIFPMGVKIYHHRDQAIPGSPPGHEGPMQGAYAHIRDMDLFEPSSWAHPCPLGLDQSSPPPSFHGPCTVPQVYQQGS